MSQAGVLHLVAAAKISYPIAYSRIVDFNKC